MDTRILKSIMFFWCKKELSKGKGDSSAISLIEILSWGF
jgi:hypothetical protein